MMRTRIKICCISNIEEARLAVKLGADALGLVSDMPSGPGVISERLIRDIVAITPPAVASVLLTCRQEAAGIIEQQRRCRVNTIQLCDAVPHEQYPLLRAALPGVSLVQVVHVGDQASIAEAIAVAPQVDAILLDSGDTKRSVKELGGTGRRHDWTVSRRIVESLDLPVFLAGGLNADNVGEAIRDVRPFGVDLCTGVRRNGTLDEAELVRFFSAVAVA